MTKRLSIFLLYFFMALSVYASPQELPEIHLLVDISGSMKQTDPDNLRITAIRLFNYLVSNRAIMSVSTFSSELEQIIPPQIVNANFQKSFLEKRKKIKANGAWTNIDAALNEANKSWSQKKKIIIFITDGMLDVGSAALNKKSTQQLNDVTIPILQKDQVQIYTIGLSKAADSNLLSNISFKTNALFQQVISAKDLDNALYAIFSAVIPVQEAPISKKHAVTYSIDTDSDKNLVGTSDKDATSTIFIDKSVHQFTLIFKKNEDARKADIYLTSPTGMKRNLKEDNSDSVSIGHYKMITIERPAPGNWILSGPSKELKQVLILTNVNLITNFSSGVYFNDELIPLSGYLEEDSKLIDSDLLLDSMTMNFQLEGETKHDSYEIPYLNKGVFQLSLLLQVPEGTYVAKWVATSKFLSRARQFKMSVQSSPFRYTFNLDHLLKVELIDPQVIDQDSVTVTIKYQNKVVNVPISRNKNVWNVDLASLFKEPSFLLNDMLIKINARLLSGRSAEFIVPIPSDVRSEQITSQLPSINLKSDASLKVKKVASLKELKVIKPKENDSTLKELKIIKPKDKDSTLSSLIFLIFILLLILIIFISFVIMRINYRKKIKKIREQSL